MDTSDCPVSYEYLMYRYLTFTVEPSKRSRGSFGTAGLMAMLGCTIGCGLHMIGVCPVHLLGLRRYVYVDN